MDESHDDASRDPNTPGVDWELGPVRDPGPPLPDPEAAPGVDLGPAFTAVLEEDLLPLEPVPDLRPPALPAPPHVDRPSALVPGAQRVVLHTTDGQVLRGTLTDADLGAPELLLVPQDGVVTRVKGASVKAVFFLQAADAGMADVHGPSLRVDFEDGRQLVGQSPGYDPGSPGFFVLPDDPRSQASRVWVSRAATRNVIAR